MSNIEPTEEQKQAAASICNIPCTEAQTWVATADDVARLLAEREAKLQARIDELQERLAKVRGESTNEKDIIIATMRRGADELTAENDTLRARVAELEADLAAFMFGEAQHLARIAELEEFQSQWQQRDGNTPGYNLQKAKNYGAQAYEWKQKAIELEAREAQHLADIKALRSAAADYVSLDYDDEHEDAKTDALVRLQRELKRLAHYDDAKAAEGGEG